MISLPCDCSSIIQIHLPVVVANNRSIYPWPAWVKKLQTRLLEYILNFGRDLCAGMASTMAANTPSVQNVSYMAKKNTCMKIVLTGTGAGKSNSKHRPNSEQ